MGLPFAPRPSNASESLCAGLEVYNSQRPPVTSAVLTFDWTITVLFFVTATVCSVMVWRLRNEFRLKSRIVLVSFMMVLVYCLFFVVVTVKKLVYPNMPCILHGMIWICLPSLQASLVIIRLVYLLNQGRYAQGALRVREIFDARHSVASEDSEALSSRPETSNSHAVSVFSLIKTTLQSKILRPSTHRHLSDDGSEVESHGGMERLNRFNLLTAKATLRNLNFILFLCMAWPVVAAIIFIFFLDVFRGNCSGCDLWAEVVIFAVALYAFSFMLRIRLSLVCFQCT